MPFQFKQFSVEDKGCAMKVGTDGVLLGAWAGAERQKEILQTTSINILDIGTGSGLIALMLAQRFPNASITAIDIDSSAASQAEQNFLVSPWAERLHCKHCSLSDLYYPKNISNTTPTSFDLIVSNPPYFENSLKTPSLTRTTARHTDTLSYEQLIEISNNLLSPNGILSLILPAWEEKHILQLAKQNSLFLNRICYIHGVEHKPAKRIMLELMHDKFSNTTTMPPLAVNNTIKQTYLVLQDKAGKRSMQYSMLTQDFYL